jgi:hypothetical protein
MTVFQNLNCILVIDESVKVKLTSNISNLVHYGVDIVDNIRELKLEQTIKTRKVVIIGHYRYDGLEDLKLYKDILDLELYLISDDPLLTRLLGSFCKCYDLDYTTITNSLLYSILYEDKSEQSRHVIKTEKLTTEGLARKLLETDISPTVREVIESYISLRHILEEQLEEKNIYTTNIRKYESQILQLTKDLEISQNNYTNLVEKVINQNILLKEYEVYFSRDIYDQIKVDRYTNRPKILYFKEYQELIHEHSFLTTLFNSIRLQHKLSCKIVRLHDSNDYFRISELESNYFKVKNEFRESDIISNDFILSYGNYMKLFDLLLTNKYELDILIVVDCKNYNKPTLIGSNLLYFNICRNIDNLSKHNLKQINTITNNSSSLMSWDTDTEYSDYLTDKDRFIGLSSKSAIRKLLGIIQSS